MNNKDGLHVLLETKKAYTREVVSYISPFIVQYFLSLYNQTKQRNKTHKYILKEFQQAIKQVASWGEDEKMSINNEIKSKHEAVEAVLNSLFVIQAKIVKSIGASAQEFQLQKNKTVDIIYNCFLNVGRELWKKPQLLYHNVATTLHHANMQQFDHVVHNTVKNTIKNIVPITDMVKSIASIVENVGNTTTHSYVDYKVDDEHENETEGTNEDDEDEDEDEEEGEGEDEDEGEDNDDDEGEGEEKDTIDKGEKKIEEEEDENEQYHHECETQRDEESPQNLFDDILPCNSHDAFAFERDSHDSGDVVADFGNMEEDCRKQAEVRSITISDSKVANVIADFLDATEHEPGKDDKCVEIANEFF